MLLYLVRDRLRLDIALHRVLRSAEGLILSRAVTLHVAAIYHVQTFRRQFSAKRLRPIEAHADQECGTDLKQPRVSFIYVG